MNPENRYRPVIRNMADLNSRIARRLQVIYGSDFDEGLVNRIASIIEKREVAIEKVKDIGNNHLQSAVSETDKKLDWFTEWIDAVENPDVITKNAGCPPPNPVLLLKLVGIVVQYSSNGCSESVPDNVTAMLSQKAMTGVCVPLMNEISGLICDIAGFAEMTKKK